ncbi:hypothetical protein QBE54_00095 [Thermatribacter velox]|uniref:SbsA Ig-like domain-containing protein n=1 Tax=Thermatribacter velox TaxID=3039681 RepID=A0ABZ2YB13_9BACT
MKKSLWLLLVVAALIAVFAVAGCMQGTTPEEPTQPEEPTTPPADTACPQVVSTVVTKMYAWNSTQPNFKITITFDENIQSQCADNPANWVITVSNPLTSRDDERFLATSNYTGTKTTTGTVTITGITIKDNQIIVEARAEDDVSAATVEGSGTFYGLICSPEDAEDYYDEIDSGNSVYWDTTSGDPKLSIDYADEISWALSSGCVISDELGNGCCGYSGSDCCVEPVCETCEEYCPLGEETCL